MKLIFRLSTALVLLLLMGCQSTIDGLAEREVDRESYYFNYEIRIPLEAGDFSKNRISLETGDSFFGSFLSPPKRKDEKFSYHTGSFMIFRNKKRYLAIQMADESYVIFELHIPPMARPTDWTAWQTPDFTSSRDGISDLMTVGTKYLARPLASERIFEMHYELVKDTYSIHDAMKKTRK